MARPDKDRSGQRGLMANRFPRGLRDLVEVPVLAPLLLAVAILIWWAADEGGFFLTTWLPGAIGMLALLALVAVAIPLRRPSTPVAAAVALLAAYAAWSFLSISWADQKGIAWEGANRTVLYAIIFALFALWPMRARAATAIVGALTGAIAVIALVELVRASGAANPLSYFVEARFAEPLGYSNGTVCLWYMAFWPAVAYASRREVHPVIRGLCAGAGVLLTEMALLGQSRSWLFGLPLVLLAFILLVPGRGRLIVTLAGVALASAIVAGPVVDVNSGYTPGDDLGGPLADATRAILLASGCTALVAGALAMVDRRVTISAGRARQISRATVAVAASAVVLVLAGLAVQSGDPVDRVADAVEDFREGGASPQVGTSRLTTLSTGRYDFWRVAWDNFESAPVRGIGIDNFGRSYRLHGRTGQQPKYPHSIEMRVLSQTGLIGVLLFGGALGFALFTIVGAMRPMMGLPAVVMGASTTSFVYWFVHGSFDWLWEFPALGGIAFALLGTATALGGVFKAPLPKSRWSVPAPVSVAGAVLVVILCTASFALPWLAERDARAAGKIWTSDPAAAIDRLDRASRLNPLTTRAELAAGTYALRLGELEKAAEEFRAALRRDRHDPYGLVNLGAISSQLGNRREAMQLLRRALNENRRDETYLEAYDAVRKGRRLDAAKVNRQIFDRGRTRLGL